MHSARNVVLGGSSITDSHPWPTWATWISRRYHGNHFFNTSMKGMGNEAIIVKTLQKAQQLENPVIVMQLTNIDKWDWYVEAPDLLREIDSERHKLIAVDQGSGSGYWSTGSHFPLWKQYFGDLYLSLQHQMFHTLQFLHWFQMFCGQQGWQYYILFDSPILSVTEKQLNTGKLDFASCHAHARDLTDNALCSLIFDNIDWSSIYIPGLIGYARLTGYQWYAERIKGHPGSLVHYHFTKDIVVPHLDQILHAHADIEQCETEATQMQKLFDSFLC